MTFGERLKWLRELKGLSQKELSEVVGISQAVISSYERDKSKPKFEHIVPLAAALGVTLAKLFDVQTMFDDKWTMQYMRSKRDILRNSNNECERIVAMCYDFVIRELELEEKRRKDLRK